MKIKRLLIANRGEIARRVIRTARQLGIYTIAIYSEADTNALHVQDADAAVALGGNTAAESYLDQAKVLAAARDTGADAIHPGYGFLSENTSFAAACEKAGIIFVGPPANAITLMGDKSAARLFMQKSGVPVLPGFDNKVDADTLHKKADEIGYPLLIKAVAGGGGKGMRAVEKSIDFAEALAAAQREAKHAFGDDQVLLERYLPTARHVEVQVFADSLGNCVYLFERDCSVQRRHQKVIEEAPAPGLSAELREKMGEAAVKAALAVGYLGAGTVEFLLAPDNQFYFMEMNTRLQVEHPVTEAITNTDLVAWQLDIAEGKPLSLSQHELTLSGHAMEVRLYAEDPWQGFLPAAGHIQHLIWPEGIRVDTGVQTGDTISPLYDPMIAKLISHGKDRDEARERLINALDALQLSGFSHNAGFLRQVLASTPFAKADLSTRLLDHHPELMEKPSPKPEQLALAATLAMRPTQLSADPWSRLSDWRPFDESLHQRTLEVAGNRMTVTISGSQAGVSANVDISTDKEEADNRNHAKNTRLLSWQQDEARCKLTLQWGDDPLSIHYWHDKINEQLVLFYKGQDYPVELAASTDHQGENANAGYVAPMNGTLLIQHVKVGQSVVAGEALVTLEAMKMEHTLHASAAGKVTAFHAKPGDTVAAGSTLLAFEAEVP